MKLIHRRCRNGMMKELQYRAKMKTASQAARDSTQKYIKVKDLRLSTSMKTVKQKLLRILISYLLTTKIKILRTTSGLKKIKSF
jgi:hypothetical protein